MDRSGSGRRAVRLGLLAGLATAACGPVSTTVALRDAAAAIEAARAADAQRYALYELTSADEYYRKACEEEGYSDFQAAMDLAREARRFAEEAQVRAAKNPARGFGPLPPPRETDRRDPDDPGRPDDGSHL